MHVFSSRLDDHKITRSGLNGLLRDVGLTWYWCWRIHSPGVFFFKIADVRRLVKPPSCGLIWNVSHIRGRILRRTNRLRTANYRRVYFHCAAATRRAATLEQPSTSKHSHTNPRLLLSVARETEIKHTLAIASSCDAIGRVLVIGRRGGLDNKFDCHSNQLWEEPRMLPRKWTAGTWFGFSFIFVL